MRPRLILSVLSLTFFLWEGSLSADCGQPHGPTETPSPTPSEEGGVPGGGHAPSTAPDTGTGGPILQEQLGTTLDPSKEGGLLKKNAPLLEEEEMDIVEGEHIITAEHFNPYTMVRIYLEYIRWASDLKKQELMEAFSEEAWETAEKKARSEAGVDAAREEHSKSVNEYNDAVQETRTQERVVDYSRDTVESQEKWVNTAGRDHPNRNGLTEGEILDNLQKGLDYSAQKLVEAQNRMSQALEAKNQAWNHYLDAMDNARKLEEKYYRQIVGEK